MFEAVRRAWLAYCTLAVVSVGILAGCSGDSSVPGSSPTGAESSQPTATLEQTLTPTLQSTPTSRPSLEPASTLELTAEPATAEATPTLTKFTVLDPSQTSVETDREALIAFYNATGGPNWERNDNWLSAAPIGDWYGVTTDDDGRVIEIEFFRNDLYGEIPPELGNLVNLERLGCVDISPQPDESGGEMKEAKVSGVQLLKPGEYPPIVLYFVDEAFHQMTLPV